MNAPDSRLLLWVPLISLAIAALAVFVGPFISLRVGKRQSLTLLAVTHKQVIAPMRQKWIDALRDRVTEVIGLAAWFYRVEVGADPAPGSAERQAQTQKLVFLIAQIELMLNPGEADHQELVRRLERMRATAVESHRTSEFPPAVAELKEYCQRILKAEWVRVKRET